MDPGSAPHVAPPLPHGDGPIQTSMTAIATTAAGSPLLNSAAPLSDPDSPIFWSPPIRHIRSPSYHSIEHLRPSQIVLEDHSGDSDDLSRACWAYSASVDEYVVVSGPTGIGAYVVWHCTVRTLKGGDLSLRKRYSEFDALHAHLTAAFPHAAAMIPALPRKSIVSRFRPEFLSHRRQGLEHFLNFILLNPEFASSPILKEFIFS